MPSTTIFTTQDSWNVDASSGWNATQTYIECRTYTDKGGGHTSYAFFKFDTSGIPSDAIVSAAACVITLNTEDNVSNNRKGRIWRITQDWTETTGANPPTNDGVLWGEIGVDSAAWATAGFDATSTSLVTLVQAWVNGTYPSYGLVIAPNDVPSTNRTIAAREHASLTEARLTVTYNRPPGAPAAITSPTGGSTWDATLTITNTAATDPEADAITYEWEYSSNGGGAWSALSGYASSLSRVIDVSAFAAATTYRVRVRAKDASGSNTPGPWTTLGSNFTISHNDAPTTPGFTSLMGATNGGAADLEAGGALVAPFNDPDVGDTPSAILIRRKIGMGSWSYWRDSDDTWQATEQENASGGVPGMTFPASVFTNGNTYTLQVAYEDALGERSPWSADFTITGVEPATVTVTDPVSPVTDTSQPIVEWSVSSPGGWDQERAVVIIEHGAYGTTPGSGTEDYDSGDIVSVTARDHQVGVPLSDGVTYRAFVRVETNDVLSSWAYRTFTMDLTVPDAPSIVVTEQPDQGRTMIEVAGGHTVIAFPAATAVVEFSDDDGDTWGEVGTAIYDSGPDAVVYDYEAPLNRERVYRARTEVEV